MVVRCYALPVQWRSIESVHSRERLIEKFRGPTLLDGGIAFDKIIFEFTVGFGQRSIQRMSTIFWIKRQML